MKRLIAFLTIPLALLFMRVIAVSDSYSGGAATPTLQEVVDTGATASGTVGFNANYDNTAVTCSHANGGSNAGHCISVTDHDGAGSGMKIVHSGTGPGLWTSHNGTGPGAYIAMNSASAGDGIYVDNQSTSQSGIDVGGTGTGNAAVVNIRGYSATGYELIGHRDILSSTPIMKLYSRPDDNDGALESAVLYVTQWGHLNIGFNDGPLDYYSMLYASSSLPLSGVRMRGTASDTVGIPLIFERAPVDGSADNDVIGDIIFKGLDSDSNLDVMAQITTTMTDTATGSEDVKICFSAMVGGTLTEIDCIGNAATDGTPTKYMGTSTGTATSSVSVATGTANTGVIITFGAHVANITTTGSYCVTCVPISINGVDLSPTCSADFRYEIALGLSNPSGVNQSVDGSLSQTSVYAVADGWNPAITNVVSFGALNTDGDCGVSTADRYNLTVTAIK